MAEVCHDMSPAAMHELSIALDLIDAICHELPRIGASQVRTVYMRIGALSGVVPEALTFAFDVAADGSPVAGARLEIEGTAGRELQLTGVEVIDGADCRDPQESAEKERPRRSGAP